MVDLSIIIPSYNTRELLLKCLESINNMEHGTWNMELIVVDNGSMDGTVEQIKKLASRDSFGSEKLKMKNLILIENRQNLGFAAAVNQGLKEANGQYLLLLNSDTLLNNNAIDPMISLMKENPQIGVVGCQLKNPDGTIQPSGGYLPNLVNLAFWMSFLDDLPLVRKFFPAYHVEDKDFYTHQRYLGWVTGAFFLTKREVFEKVGFFDEKMFMYIEEVDWCQRVKDVGYKVAFNPNVSIIHYKGASSDSGNHKDSRNLFGRRAGILEEYQGLKYYFKKYKPSWQALILRSFLKLGALARILVFGIILKDPQARRIYAKAYRMA